jgi:NADPH-dependent 2,4-dienoyl-CoA reductase/sulfur reductase-like enzyme
MEVAASAALRDCDVTVIELAPHIMARALPAAMSLHLEAYHHTKGVKLRLGAMAVSQAAGETPGLKLSDGSIIAADIIVIGIGVVPNIELAASAGLSCADGIVVDEYGATSAADVFAAGDAVSYPDSFFQKQMRSENWMHAQNQAAVVAKNVLGAKLAYRQIPYMWSDQYDLKIQTVGRCDSGTHVTRGDLAKNKFMLLHTTDGRVIGATGINEARDIKYVQRLIESGAVIDTVKLADPNFNLKKAADA